MSGLGSPSRLGLWNTTQLNVGGVLRRLDSTRSVSSDASPASAEGVAGTTQSRPGQSVQRSERPRNGPMVTSGNQRPTYNRGAVGSGRDPVRALCDAMIRHNAFPNQSVLVPTTVNWGGHPITVEVAQEVPRTYRGRTS
jgi:hypothetical protein